MRAAAADAVTQRAAEGGERPVPDAGRRIGRDVGGIDGAERRRDRPPAGKRRAVRGGVTHRAIADCGEGGAVRDLRGREGCGGWRRDRADRRVPGDRTGGTPAGEQHHRDDKGEAAQAHGGKLGHRGRSYPLPPNLQRRATSRTGEGAPQTSARARRNGRAAQPVGPSSSAVKPSSRNSTPSGVPVRAASCSRRRSSTRRILPEIVFGSAANAIRRMRL